MKPPRSIYNSRLSEHPDLAFADDAAFARRGAWRDSFQQRIGREFDGRIIFEIGCADARFVSNVAQANPRAGFIGIDWKCKAIYDGAVHINSLGLRNVVLVRGRGQDVRRIFADGEVDEILILHPDPCATEHELKNRLFAEPFLMDAHRVLRDACSTITLKTDHAGYYQWALSLFGVPQPPHFAAAPKAPINAAVAPTSPRPRVRVKDLLTPEQIPAASDALKRAFAVDHHSADFWNDPTALAHAATRCFAHEITRFESRFIRKRQPIYYFEIRKLPAVHDPA